MAKLDVDKTMKWKNILVTGGNGLLGTELQKHLKARYLTRCQLDITDIKFRYDGDLIVHLACYTNVDRAEVEKEECFDVNVVGTYNVLRHYRRPIVYLSTEHVYAEGVHYKSKLIGELLVKTLSNNYLIVRTLFKSNPYPWDYAFKDQMTRGDYVDVIAPMIADEIRNWK